MYSCLWLPIFQRHISPLSSELKLHRNVGSHLEEYLSTINMKRYIPPKCALSPTKRESSSVARTVYNKVKALFSGLPLPKAYTEHHACASL